MPGTLKLYDLSLSPNNKRARLVLGIKKLEYERIPVDPENRDAVTKVSGQPLTPVLVHGETVIFDSWAIMRYLDVNTDQGPRLYSADRAVMQEIERYESFARQEMSPPVWNAFRQFLSGNPDKTVLERAAKDYGATLEQLDAALEDRPYLLGDEPTAADVGCAALLNIAWLTPLAIEQFPILRIFREYFGNAPGSDKLRRWYASLDRFDAFRLPQDLP